MSWKAQVLSATGVCVCVRDLMAAWNILAKLCTPSKEDSNYLDFRLFGAMIDNVSLTTSGLKERFYFWGTFRRGAMLPLNAFCLLRWPWDKCSVACSLFYLKRSICIYLNAYHFFWWVACCNIADRNMTDGLNVDIACKVYSLSPFAVYSLSPFAVYSLSPFAV